MDTLKEEGKSTVRLLWLGLIGLLAIVAVGFGLAWWLSGQKETAEKPTPAASIEPKISETKPEPETTAQTQTLVDKAGLYTVKILKSWSVKTNEGAKGVQVSRIEAQSPDWQFRTDETAEGPFTPYYYEKGAALTIHVTTTAGSTRHGQVISQKTVTVDGVSGTYHVFKEPSTMAGQFIDVHLTKEGKSYLIQLTYNPETYSQGEQVFADILDSLKFSG